MRPKLRSPGPHLPHQGFVADRPPWRPLLTREQAVRILYGAGFVLLVTAAILWALSGFPV